MNAEVLKKHASDVIKNTSTGTWIGAAIAIFGTAICCYPMGLHQGDIRPAIFFNAIGNIGTPIAMSLGYRRLKPFSWAFFIAIWFLCGFSYGIAANAGHKTGLEQAIHAQYGDGDEADREMTGIENDIPSPTGYNEQNHANTTAGFVYTAIIAGIILLRRRLGEKQSIIPSLSSFNLKLGLAPPTTTQQLSELEQLKAQNLITEEEYQQKRQKILSNFGPT